MKELHELKFLPVKMDDGKIVFCRQDKIEHLKKGELLKMEGDGFTIFCSTAEEVEQLRQQELQILHIKGIAVILPKAQVEQYKLVYECIDLFDSLRCAMDKHPYYPSWVYPVVPPKENDIKDKFLEWKAKYNQLLQLAVNHKLIDSSFRENYQILSEDKWQSDPFWLNAKICYQQSDEKKKEINILCKEIQDARCELAVLESKIDVAAIFTCYLIIVPLLLEAIFGLYKYLIALNDIDMQEQKLSAAQQAEKSAEFSKAQYGVAGFLYYQAVEANRLKLFFCASKNSEEEVVLDNTDTVRIDKVTGLF